MKDVNKNFSTVHINGKKIAIRVISDDQPEMDLVYALWYDVYVEELGYQLAEGVDHANRRLFLPPNGSIIYMALDGDVCISSLRASFSHFSPLEFDYHEWLPDSGITELTKLIARREYRKTPLSAHILCACYRYNTATLPPHMYDYVVINCTPRMLPFYNLFGFAAITDELVIHPDIKNKSLILKCSRAANKKAVYEMEKMLKGDLLIKAKWAVKRQWYKTRAKGMPLLSRAKRSTVPSP